MKFDIRHFSDTLIRRDDVTAGDMIDLERLTCEARALRGTICKRGERKAIMKELARVHRDARVIIARYRA